MHFPQITLIEPTQIAADFIAKICALDPCLPAGRCENLREMYFFNFSYWK